MSYRYLLDLYKVLDERISAAEVVVPGGKPDPYQKGRQDCLVELKTFLREHYHSQLPRSIRATIDSEE